MPAVVGQSSDPDTPAVSGTGQGGAKGVLGQGATGGDGVFGDTSSNNNNGVVGTNQSTAQATGGIPGGNGVYGHTQNPNASGVYGAHDTGGNGVFGACFGTGAGVFGTSTGYEGVHGETASAFAGVAGYNLSGGAGVWGQSAGGEGVHGETNSALAAVAGYNNNGPAGYFGGNVVVTGDITLTGGQDCAEEFDFSTGTVVDPGTVMVLNQSGSLEESSQAYEKKVAGIVSGAGNYKAALVLDKRTKDHTTGNKRVPIALMGKVYCKVDATSSSIEIGDLLTTSPTKGHAMKAEDPFKAFGAVIGKAMGSLKEGLGMIPVLVALQ
jgi:hypothetical protein